MRKKKATYKELIEYLDQATLRIENNQRAIYDLCQTLNDYMHMQGEFDNFSEYRQKVFGLDAEIPTRWSKFSKFCKSKYLKLKKKLDF